MQIVSEKFKEDIRNTRKIRNRAYIKSYVGIINQDAQNNAMVDKSKSRLTYFSNEKTPFNAEVADKIYATGEKDFSHVDGSMFFLPRKGTLNLYNNGIVSEKILGNVYISFGKEKGLDIKGLTINFGEYFPTEFTIEYDEGIKHYENNSSIWTTEDVFSNVSFFNIKATRLINEFGRLRIYEFSCGLVKSFSNDNVINCVLKESISPISETISSQDLTLEVENKDLYFDVDDENSAIAFMETGQEIRIIYGYDVDGTGNIEWLEPQTCYLSSWNATDRVISFHATDRFALMEGKFYKGIYREQGISLYDLAIEVLNDAGIVSEKEYFLDPYLKNIVVYNPIPPIPHKEALQIIANAGRCKLYQGRDTKIYIKSDFVPQKVAETNDIAEFSNVQNVLKADIKKAYAMGSKDFSKVDGSVYFLPRDKSYLPIGYVSKSLSDESGNFKVNPKITIALESSFVCFGMMLNFRNVKPEIFEVRTYLQNIPVQKITIENPQINCVIDSLFKEFDKMEIEFIKGHPNARITVDNILLGEYTDYHLTKDCMKKQPERKKNEKVKEISVNELKLSKSSEEKELLNLNLVLQKGKTEYTAYFDEPHYDFQAFVDENPQIACKIVEHSAFYVKISFEGIQSETAIKFRIVGHEYIKNNKFYTVVHNQHGESIEWNNPLISTDTQAEKLEKWLSSYLLGSVDYNIDWWGDPTTDVGDLFYFLTQKGNETLIKSYESELKFDSGWSGTMKARRVVLE